MDQGRNTSVIHMLWDRLFQTATRKAVLVASVVGLCGVGTFWGARQWVELGRHEKLLIEQHSDSEYIKSHVSFVDVERNHLRIFYAQHSLFTCLPRPSPLIVFIHGVGGQINQFEPLLKHFRQVADVLALDLPGCGQSPLVDRRWHQFSTDALATLVNRVIEGKSGARKVILVAHSLGCLIAGRLAMKLNEKCLGVVLLSPKAEITEKERKGIRLLTRLPELIFNIFRKLDRTGGIRSPSVRRVVGSDVSDDIRAQQLVWNMQSQTPTTLRMLNGAMPMTREEWHSLQVPVLIILGEEDKVCPPTDGEKIRLWLSTPNTPDPFIVPSAGHALMIEAAEIVCSVIDDFLVKLDPDLSRAWQLSYAAGDKWGLKNEQKWLSIKNVSELVGSSPLRAMKTLRQTDHTHSPFHLIHLYPRVRHVIDISHGINATYDPISFHNTHVTHHKFPTSTKIPPTEDDVSGFIAIVRKCLAASSAAGDNDAEICVHCHYGFNRTGFVICCWLIEEEGYGVNQALEAFKVARPNGIRHLNFISTLQGRYPGL